MATGRTTLLNLPLPTEGELDGSWGDMVNKGMTEYLDIAIAGTDSLTSANFTAGALTLANTTGTDVATNIASTSAQYATIRVSSLAQASTITAPSSSRSYRIINDDATYSLTIKASGQTGVTFSAGQTGVVAFNGTDYALVGTIGPTVPVARGGTGATTLTANNVILGNGTSAVQFVAPGSSGNVLTSNGTTWTSTTPASTTTLTINNKTGAYTVVAGDNGTIINCTSGTFTVSLTAAATLGSGFNCWVKNYGSGVITIDPNGSETIDDYFSIALRAGESVQILCTGTAFITNDGQYQQGMSVSRQPGAGRPVASATNGSAIGSNSAGNASQAVTGAGAMALGGSYASGTDSFAAAIANNTSSYGATGSNSIAIGYLAKATGSNGCVIGGGVGSSAGSVASHNSAAFGAFGGSATSGGILIGGDSGQVTADKAVVISGQSASASVKGKIVFGAASNFTGIRADLGHCQTGFIVLLKATTDATAAILSSDAATAGSTNQVILPNNSAYAFSALIVARQQAAGGTQSAAWKIEGLIRREGSAGTTTLVNSATTVLDNTPGWTIAVSADTTNGGLAITATGAASTNIRWVATVQTSEVTYA